jgi:FkbM family methyltransferase
MLHEIGKLYMRSIRDWRPLNVLATGTIKGICNLLDRRCPDFAVWHLPRCGTVKARLPNGSELQLSSRRIDFIGNQVYWRGWTAHEPEALPLFYLLAGRSNLILDIGANMGLYSLVASYANPRSSIFAFEPHMGARQQFSTNIRHNRRTNIEIIPCAVSNRPGHQLLYCPGVPSQSIPGTSSLSHVFIAPSRPTQATSILVETTAIDQFCEQRGIDRIDLAKLDIEGLEPEAIVGMQRMIERSAPHLFLEIIAGKGTDGRLDELARQFGYNVFALDLDGAHFQPQLVVDKRRTNYLFTRMAPREVLVLVNTARSFTERA